MENTTLGVAILTSVLVVILRPPIAFAAYVALLLFYPCYLTLSIGTINITAARIVTAVLLVRCLTKPELRRCFKWQPLDKCVAFSMLVYVGMTFTAMPLKEAIENRGGFLLDTGLAYLVARLCITDREAFVTTIKWIALILVPLAILGVIESCTGWQPYMTMMRYCPWEIRVLDVSLRSGFFRATGAFGHSIMFGTVFVLFLPMVYYLRHERGYWGTWAYPLSIVLIIGALSSMSSGPWVSVIFVILCLAMEHFKKWLKLVLIGILLSCIFIGIASNRPFYHVIVSYANPIGGSGWHRAKLIDCAIQDFGEWYLKGYGGEDPGWGESLGMDHTDITNEFIFAGVRYGLLGVIALCTVLAIAIRQSVRLHNSASDPRLRSLAWALGSIIATVILVFTSVSIFTQTLLLFYCVLGMIGSSANFTHGPVQLKSSEVFWPQEYIHAVSREDSGTALKI